MGWDHARHRSDRFRNQQCAIHRILDAGSVLTNPAVRADNYILISEVISEDVLKDGRRLYENGLNTPNIPAAIDSSLCMGKGACQSNTGYQCIQQ